VTVVVAEEVREKGGAIDVSYLLRTFVESEIPIALPTGVLGTFSVLETGKSFLVDKAEDARAPVYCEFPYGLKKWSVKPPPPEPVLPINSPPEVSYVLPGTGDGAADPFVAPTFLICARTCDSFCS
jgi:hypothetical protein